MLHGGLLVQYIDVRRWCWMYDTSLVDSASLLFVELVVPVIWARNLLEAVSLFVVP